MFTVFYSQDDITADKIDTGTRQSIPLKYKNSERTQKEMERHILDPIDWRVSIPMMGASLLALSQVTHPTGLRAERGR